MLSLTGMSTLLGPWENFLHGYNAGIILMRTGGRKRQQIWAFFNELLQTALANSTDLNNRVLLFAAARVRLDFSSLICVCQIAR